MFFREFDDEYKKYGFEKNTRRVEIIDRVDTHLFCVAYRKVVFDRDNGYCERSNHIFDD